MYMVIVVTLNRDSEKHFENLEIMEMKTPPSKHLFEG